MKADGQADRLSGGGSVDRAGQGQAVALLCLRIVLLATLLVPTAAFPLRAQEDSRLVAAVRLAQDGQGDSARALVRQLLAQTPTTDTLYPQIVYTMGLVARDAEERSRDFRRVTVEFGSSSWADDALLGLAWGEFASGNATGAARDLERLRADYPLSPLLPTAAYWAARSYFEMNQPDTACNWLSQGLEGAGNDVELKNQLTYYAPRCATTAGAAPAPAAPTPAAPAASSGFSVQIAAVGTEAAARTILASLKEAGYTGRIVQAAGLYKVRTEIYPTRERAQAAQARLRQRLGGTPFLVEEP